MTQKDTNMDNAESKGTPQPSESSASQQPPSDKSKDKNEKTTEEDLSEEDQQLKNELEMLVERLKVISCSSIRGMVMQDLDEA